MERRQTGVSNALIWVACGFLVGSLALSALLVLDYHSLRLRVHAEDGARKDLELLRYLVEQALQEQNLERLTDSFRIWGRQREDLVQIRLLANNGFVLEEYQRGSPAEESIRAAVEIVHARGRTATLELVRDLAGERGEIRQLGMLLAAGTLILASVLALLALAVVHGRRQGLRLQQWGERWRASEQERHSALQEHRLAQAYLRGVLDNMPSTLIAVDPQLRITEWNQAAELASRIRREDALGLPLSELMPQLSGRLDIILDAMTYGAARRESRFTTIADGAVHYYDLAVFPVSQGEGTGALIRIDDLTQRLRLEQMAVQTEKMSSLGALASGLAQEINNPLSGIMQNCQTILRRLTPKLDANRQAAAECDIDLQRLQAYLDLRTIPQLLGSVRAAAERATRIVDRMLAFSSRSSGSFEQVDVEQLLENAIRLAGSHQDLEQRYELQQVEFTRDYIPHLPALQCDRVRLEQVLVNLIHNAAQAMSLAATPAPRRVRLRTRLDDDMILIEVIDNGPGMSDETRRRAFEPFFTTKRETSWAAGLGLSVCFFIVTEQHKGRMELSSAPRHGTRVSLWLPITGDRGGSDASLPAG